MPRPETDGIRAFSSLRTREFDEFMIEAAKNFDAKRAAVREDVRITRWAEVSLDTSRRVCHFTTADGRTFEAPVLVVGSYNSADSTWEWGWNNPFLSEPLRGDSIAIKRFGEARGWDPLTEGIVAVSTNAVWGLIAVAVEVLGAAGAHNVTVESLEVIIAYRDLRPLMAR